MTMLIIYHMVSTGDLSESLPESSRILEIQECPELKNSSPLRSSSISRVFHILSESKALASQRSHQMFLASSTYDSRATEPSRVFQTRVFYRRKASQQIILNIMKSVGKTLRKNLSILEVKGLGEYQKGKLQAKQNQPLFQTKASCVFKKQKVFALSIMDQSHMGFANIAPAQIGFRKVV